ncbi:hypothetical protein DPMN_086172 [Dreissena polymorpha]|uniref:Uncharacterized protein n=1 Tax=Dreissena polymorpha TaxID=45954 RepID=A0A9D3YE15_DREPO|nr:hypothetical protein DPMN_086172 [Dreissena polymorpha]
MYHSINKSFLPPIHLSIHPFIHPSIHPSIHACINVSMHTSIHPSLHLYIHPSIYPSIHLSIRFCITAQLKSYNSNQKTTTLRGDWQTTRETRVFEIAKETVTFYKKGQYAREPSGRRGNLMIDA